MDRRSASSSSATSRAETDKKVSTPQANRQGAGMTSNLTLNETKSGKDVPQQDSDESDYYADSDP